MKNQFLRPNGVENVSNMSQSVWNIIIDDQKHILDLRKSHKGRLKKSASTPPLKKFPYGVLTQGFPMVLEKIGSNIGGKYKGIFFRGGGVRRFF